MSQKILLLALSLLPLLASAQPRPDNSPQWIWAQKTTDDDVIYFRKTFDLPGDAEAIKGLRADFWGSCDNVMNVTINGNVLGFSTEWQKPMSHEISKHLKPGKNVIIVKGTNLGSSAGMVSRATITMGAKRTVIRTDETWKYLETEDKNAHTADYDDTNWKAVKVIGRLGIQPWGRIDGDDGRPIMATPVENLQLLPGFNAELLYTVPKATQGSWVAICVDPKGRLITSDQSGSLYRVTVGQAAADTKVEPIKLPIGQAQGLLCAFDALYVVVNGGGVRNPGGQTYGSGLYRLTDTDNDDQYDKIETLKKFNGAGEHGPHAVVLGPDKESLYLVAGNFTKPPEGFRADSPHKNWAEDHLLPRNPDGGGHDPNVWAPGGWVAKTDKDGKDWTLVAAGMRNAYDIAFNADGELFNYDSDMEWDTGTPWYRPIRVNLLVSGGEYGWRNGTGKWPEFYPDSLGAVVNTGLGSPVGVAFGYGARFPAKYQHAFYIQDWSYGKIYAVHITPQGAGYTGTFETFVGGKGFPVTDMTVGLDGSMYVTIGGRGTQSGLYRVTYTGNEPTAPATATRDSESAKAREKRHAIEAFHGHAVGKTAVQLVFPYLNSQDRYLRYAARIALEWQPIETWKAQVLAEKRPTALINGAIGLIRANTKVVKVPTSTTIPCEYEVFDKTLQQDILAALNRLNFKTLTEEQQLEAIRAYGLAFIRLGAPDSAAATTVANKFMPLFPSASPTLNRELAQLLVYLQSPTVIAKSMDLLAQSSTQEDQLHYVLILRNIASGWTIDQRKAYFSWIGHAMANYKGGASFKKFLTRIKDDAIKTLTDDERKALDAILKGEYAAVTVKVTRPRQFVRNWQMHDFAADIDKATTGRNFANGKKVFEEAQCSACHRFAGDGGATGPDLSGVGNRFTPLDTLETVLLPSKVISDQYQTTLIDTTDGDTQVGRVAQEDEQKILLQTNPLTLDTIEIAKKDVKARGLSKVSMMPQGLVDNFTKDEILDLVAYLRSAGDPKDKAFAK